jgi:hypothetical protein
VEKLLEAVGGPDSMRQLAAKHLIRMYPGGTRVDSSNYDPQDAWSSGMQVLLDSRALSTNRIPVYPTRCCRG